MLSRKTELMHLFEGAMLALRNSRARELNELHCGNFHVAPLLVRTGMARGGAPLAQQQTFIVVWVVLVLSNAGRWLGLDVLLFKRL